MRDVSVQDLRNDGGQVLDRVLGGEPVTITRDGRPIARLVPVATGRTGADALIRRFRSLPEMDPVWLRRDLDALLDGPL